MLRVGSAKPWSIGVQTRTRSRSPAKARADRDAITPAMWLRGYGVATRVCGQAVRMAATDIYRPDEWRDFFVMVGGGGAGLTRLVVVALSLNLPAILLDAVPRAPSIRTLANFRAGVVICAPA